MTAAERTGAPVATLTVGALLVVAGGLWVADELGAVDVPWSLGLALAVLAVGVLLLVTSRSRHAGGLVPLGIVLSALLVLTVVLPSPVVTDGGAGDRRYRPTSVTELAERYELGAGTLVLDLRDLRDPPDAALADPATPTRTEVEVGVGEIRVLVPADLAVDVTAEAGTGEVTVLGERREGLSPSLAVPADADTDAVLVLDLRVGLGTVEVTR